MRKLLFTTLAVFAILGCSSRDNMPCVTCDDSEQQDLYAYCIYNNKCEYKSIKECSGDNYGKDDTCGEKIYCLYQISGGYRCSYMSIRTCDGGNYGKDSTCGDYLGQDSTYCLYYDYTSSYRCEYKKTRECIGDIYREDNTCGGYWWRSSSSSSSSEPSSSSFSGSCNIKDYRTVKIGDQVWMAENYNCEVNGSKCYNNDPANCSKYGRLYSWATAMSIGTKYNKEWWDGSDENHKGICPRGWHIPSDEEWDNLIYSVDWSEGTLLKATYGWNWNDYDGISGNGTDDYGFSALPGGNGYPTGGFSDIGNYGYWWSATESESDAAYNRYMSYDSEYVSWDYYSKSNLLNVRCVQD